jgi:hypothetical protein
MSEKKIIIEFNPVDNSIPNWMSEWINLINLSREKERIEQLRKDRKIKIENIFKNI